MVKGKYTLIENRWTKEIDGVRKVCFVYFYYNRTLSPVPFVRISGYNPFPCFNDFFGFYTTRVIFNKWMQENGWNLVKKVNDTIRKGEVTF